MSIATRISSMEEHIKESYQELKGIGLDITGFDKNLENIPRVIDNYWETLPKVSGNGTNITLDNTKEGKMKIELKGDTSQYTTTGLNLQKYNPRTTGTDRVYTCSNNGQISITGSVNSITDYAINQSGNEMSLEAGTYIVKVVGDLGGVTKLTKNIGGTTTDMVLDSNQEATFTLDTASNVRTLIHVIANVTYNSNFYVTCAKDTATTERYTGGIPSPSPSFPQDIEVVTETQYINISNKNLFDKITSETNKRIAVSTGGSYNKADYSISKYIEVTANIDYALTTGTTSYYSWYDSTQTFISGGSWENQTSKTSPNNAKYVRFDFVTADIDSIQFEKNSVATDYVTHQEQNYTINLGTLELCKIGDYQDKIYRTSGKNLFNKDTTYVKNISIQTNTNKTSSSSNARTSYIECQPNTKYTISKSQVSARFIIATSKVVPASGINLLQTLTANSSTSATITTDAEAKYLLVYYYLSTSDTLTEEQIRNTIQIEYGDTATTYEAYGYGEWYKHKEIGKYVFDGTENWVSQPNYGTNSWSLNNIISVDYDTTKVQILSTKFRGISQDNRNTGGNNTIYTVSNTSFYIRNTNLTTKAEVQTATNGTPIYYILATPVEEAITEPTLVTQLNNLYYASSYEEQTNINSRGILATDMSANALEDSSN